MTHEDPAGANGAEHIPTTTDNSHSQTALRDGPSHVRLWLAAGLGLAADLTSKSLAFSHLNWAETTDAVPHVLQFVLRLNPGALFGTGSGFAPLFVVASILAVPFILFVFAQSSRRRWSIQIALGLIMAGAMGNLYDRVFVVADVVRDANGHVVFTGQQVPSANDDRIYLAFHGSPDQAPVYSAPGPPEHTVRSQGVVRDFLKFDIKFRRYDLYPWVFNIADALLVVGVGLLLINSLRDVRAARQATQLPVPSPGSDNPQPKPPASQL